MQVSRGIGTECNPFLVAVALDEYTSFCTGPIDAETEKMRRAWGMPGGSGRPPLHEFEGRHEETSAEKSWARPGAAAAITCTGYGLALSGQPEDLPGRETRWTKLLMTYVWDDPEYLLHVSFDVSLCSLPHVEAFSFHSCWLILPL